MIILHYGDFINILHVLYIVGERFNIALNGNKSFDELNFAVKWLMENAPNILTEKTSNLV